MKRSIHPSRRNRRPAFTLIEVVAATTLAAMLLGTLASVLVMGARQKRQAEARRQLHPAVTLLAEQIRRDVLNARFIQADRAALRLVGPLSHDLTTKAPTGRLAEVIYQVASLGAGPWLVRRQRPLDEIARGQVSQEALWAGATAIEVLVLEDSATTSSRVQGAPPGMRPMPQRLAVVLRGPTGRAILETQIRHHWEDH